MIQRIQEDKNKTLAAFTDHPKNYEDVESIYEVVETLLTENHKDAQGKVWRRLPGAELMAATSTLREITDAIDGLHKHGVEGTGALFQMKREIEGWKASLPQQSSARGH